MTAPFNPTTQSFNPTTRPFSPSTQPFDPNTQSFEDAAAASEPAVPEPLAEPAVERSGPPSGPDLPLDFGLDIDLDIDLSVPAPPSVAPVPEITRPMPRMTVEAPAQTNDFALPFDNLGSIEPAPGSRHADSHIPDAGPASLDFDISDLGALPFGADTPAAFDLGSVNSGAPLITDPGALGFDERLGGTTPSRDPAQARSEAYERKIELAEEFRQIGDAEGARELLLEVVARASGAQKARAQRMLDALT